MKLTAKLLKKAYDESEVEVGTITVNGRTAPLIVQSCEDEGEHSYHLFFDWGKLLKLEGYNDLTTLLINTYEDPEPPIPAEMEEDLGWLASNFKEALAVETTGSDSSAELFAAMSDQDVLWFQGVSRENISWRFDFED